nr:hypothetical protein [Tanacetum cinerariifolium]
MLQWIMTWVFELNVHRNHGVVEYQSSTASVIRKPKISKQPVLGLNTFSYAKLTTFVFMCKAYGCEPSGDLFRGFFNLCRAEMDLRKFIYTEDDEDLSLLPKEPSPSFGTGSLSVSVNTEPLKSDEELVIRPAEVTAKSKESLNPKLFLVHLGSVAAWIKDKKYKTRGGSSRPPVK